MKSLAVILIALFAFANAAPSEVEPRIFSTLKEALKKVLEEVLLPAVDNQVKNVALLAAQLLAGLSETGLKDVVGKRFIGDLLSDLADAIKKELLPHADEAFKSLALTLAQLLAELSEKGIGKREETSVRIFSTLKEALKKVLEEVLLPAVDNQVKNVALLAAQLLAGLSETGLKDIVGKRFVGDFFSQLADALKKELLPHLDEAFKSLALTAAQLLAELSEKGIGKREETSVRIFSTLKEALKKVLEEVLLPAVDNQVKNVALLAAQLLAGLSETGLKDIVGKRFVGDLLSQLADALKKELLPHADEAFKSLALTLAQLLAQLSENGIGK